MKPVLKSWEKLGKTQLVQDRVLPDSKQTTGDSWIKSYIHHTFDKLYPLVLVDFNEGIFGVQNIALTVPLHEEQKTTLFNLATGVITPISGVMGPYFITGRRPPCNSIRKSLRKFSNRT